MILLLNAEPDLIPVALHASMELRHTLRTVHTCKDAFRFLNDGADVDVILLDLDPDIQGMALLNTLDAGSRRVPLIALTSLDVDYVKPIVTQHGATECLGKPVTVPQLVAAIEKFTSRDGI